MQQTLVEYRNAIRALSDGEEPPAGFTVVTLDRTGKQVSGLASFLPGKRSRIAVHRNFHRSITNATERIKHFLEPQVFQTAEKTEFNLRLRLTIDASRAVEIAEKHFDPLMEPEDIFFREFARQLLELLESSARRETGTIDKRIGANRRQWQEKLENALSLRFGVGVEIIFDIEREVASDKIVRTQPGDFRHVHFRDRIDKTYPLSIELRLRAEEAKADNSALPREESKLKTNLFDMIARTCEQQLTLFDYWFAPARLHDAVKEALDAYLADYAHSLANLQISGGTSKDAAAPPRSEKVEEVVTWRDSRGYELQFRAEAVVLIAEDGAGLYDRSGRPDRNAWFRDAITRALKLRLAGVSVIALNEEAIAKHKEAVEGTLIEAAEEIGLKLDLYIGKAYLPNQRWNTPTIVPVASRAYQTADPRISGHFSMDLELSFERRAAAEAFMNEYHQQRLYGSGGEGNDAMAGEENALPDAFIEKQIRDLATEAAAFEMQMIPPTDYFIDFVARKSWQTPVPTLGEPGAIPGANRIETRIRDTLQRRYPGVRLGKLHFHRGDESLEQLRRLVASLNEIRFECVIADHIHMNAAFDRTLRGSIFIESGDAERIVWMLHKDLDKLTPEVFRSQISAHLADFVEQKLFDAEQKELNGLMASLTSSASNYTDQTRLRLEEAIRGTLRRNFGLLCGDIGLIVAMSDDYKLFKDERRDALLDPIRMNQLERASLKRQYETLLSERESITGVSDADVARRAQLTEELARTRQQMDTRQADADGRRSLPSSDYIHRAGSLFAPRADGAENVPQDDVPDETPGATKARTVIDLTPRDENDDL